MKKNLFNLLLMFVVASSVTILTNTVLQPKQSHAQDKVSLVGKEVIILVNDHEALFTVEDLVGKILSVNDNGVFLACKKRADYGSRNRIVRFDYDFTLFVPWDAILIVKVLKPEKK